VLDPSAVTGAQLAHAMSATRAVLAIVVQPEGPPGVVRATDLGRFQDESAAMSELLSVGQRLRRAGMLEPSGEPPSEVFFDPVRFDARIAVVVRRGRPFVIAAAEALPEPDDLTEFLARNTLLTAAADTELPGPHPPVPDPDVVYVCPVGPHPHRQPASDTNRTCPQHGQPLIG
jgi:hypothetical protein